MFKFSADENFDGRLFRGLRRGLPSLDLVRIQDEGLRSAPDPEVLDWCAAQGRLLLTHDIRTMPSFLSQRMMEGRFGVGVLLIVAPNRKREVIDDLLFLVQCSDYSEWVDRVSYLPLR